MSWRLDSNVVASASEDGTVRLWEMENGAAIKTGRPRRRRRLGPVRQGRPDRSPPAATGSPGSGTRTANKVRDFEPFDDLALRAAFTHDDARVLAGDWSGEVRVWDAKDGKRLGNLVANPAPIAARLDPPASSPPPQAAADAATQGLADLQAAAAAKAAAQPRPPGVRRLDAGRRRRRRPRSAPPNKALQAKTAEEQAAVAALTAAQAAAQKAAAEKAAAEKAVADTTAAEKAASTPSPPPRRPSRPPPTARPSTTRPSPP